MAAQPPFALHPADAIPGVIDLATREGIKLYQNATRSFYLDPADCFNCETPGLHGFLKEVEGKSIMFWLAGCYPRNPKRYQQPPWWNQKSPHALWRTNIRTSTCVGRHIPTWDISGSPRHDTPTPIPDELPHPSWKRQSSVMVRSIHTKRVGIRYPTAEDHH